MSYQTNLRLLKVRAPAEGQTCGDLIKALHRGGGTPAAMPHDLLRKVTPVELTKVSTAPASAPAANTAARP